MTIERKDIDMRMVYLLLLALALPALLLTGCRESAQSSAADSDVSITLTIAPDPPAQGDATLLVTITRADQPVEGAAVDIRGDMNHAGMQPVIREDVMTDANGAARIPFEWTMGGEWFVVVTAELPDGTTVEQRFEDISVEGTMPGDMDMGDGDMEMQTEPATEEAP